MDKPDQPPELKQSLNRTSVGLKRSWITLEYLAETGLNRTSVGLKHYIFRCELWNATKPQSNQRGIETRAEHWFSSFTKRLNRTSVGLKLGRPVAGGNGRVRLNRTSVGLKPDQDPGPGGGSASPQSNQRGIETSKHLFVLPKIQASLNRTSVGLKRGRLLSQEVADGGLNRTSVGLKLSSITSFSLIMIMASIEPAWD